MRPSTALAAKRPRYQQIAETLLAAIARGDYRVGGTLPTEAQLCAQFGVSRFTVRAAIRALAQIGLVASQAGIGTQVVSTEPRGSYVQTLKSVSDLWQYVKDAKLELIQVRDVTTEQVDVPLPGKPGQGWRMLEGRRYVDQREEPVAWTQVFVLPAYGAVFDEVRPEMLIYALIEREFGVTTQTVRQTITAVEIAPRVAKHLGVKPHSAGLGIRREYVSSTGKIYEVAWSVHPIDRYKYSMEITLAYGAS